MAPSAMFADDNDVPAIIPSNADVLEGAFLLNA